MGDFTTPGWETLLRRNGLGGFDDIWNLDLPRLEPASRRRGGWSNIVRAELDAGAAATLAVFVKRQGNHARRTPRHPLRGQSTYRSELQNIRRLTRYGVPTVTPVCFAERRIGGNLRAVMITEALNGFRPLDDLVREWEAGGWPARGTRRRLFESVGRVLRTLHERRVQHGSLYPRHVFVQLSDLPSVATSAPAVRLIDLESARRRLARRQAACRDLDSLNRHSPQWSRTDRLRFLLSYLGIERATPDAKQLFRRIAAMARAPGHRAATAAGATPATRD